MKTTVRRFYFHLNTLKLTDLNIKLSFCEAIHFGFHETVHAFRILSYCLRHCRVFQSEFLFSLICSEISVIDWLFLYTGPKIS